jgi:UMF1 family MFS transporter
MLTGMAEMSACGYRSSAERVCRGEVELGPVHLAAGSVASFTVAAATIAAALTLPLFGLLVDRSIAKRGLLMATAATGATAGVSLSLLPPNAWLPAAGLAALTAVSLACSLVASDSIMVSISSPAERDRVSTTGWAVGYAGGLIVLIISLFLISGQPPDDPKAVGQAVALGGAWWGLWTLVPFLTIRDRELDPRIAALPTGPSAPLVQLLHTFSALRTLPNAARFLIAFVVFNDGIQSLLSSASIFATRELGLSAAQMVLALIVAQVVAAGGSLAFRRVAAKMGTKRTIMTTLVIWATTPLAAAVLPAGALLPFLAVIGTTGLVMGATQALSRSLYSQLIPASRAAEFFGLYQAADRGTSWFGALLFGLTYQLTGQYRIAVAVLVGFFLLGLPLLARVDVTAGTAAAARADARVGP